MRDSRAATISALADGEHFKWSRSATARTPRIGIWIATGGEHSLPAMQQFVIGHIFADDQISACIVAPIIVEMVNMGLWRERFP